MKRAVTPANQQVANAVLSGFTHRLRRLLGRFRQFEGASARRVPAPVPVAVKWNDGRIGNASARKMAAPVGVTSSPSPSPARISKLRSSSTVAGAGTGSRPCSLFT